MPNVRSIFIPVDTKGRLARAANITVDSLQLILGLLQGPASVTGVPGLNAGIQGLLFVVDVIKKKSQNVDDLERLADSIIKLNSALNTSMNAAGTPSPAMQVRLDGLMSEWNVITTDVRKLASRGWLGGIINYKNDAASIASAIQLISQSIERFTIGTVVSIESGVTRIEGRIDHVQESINDGFQEMMARSDTKAEHGRPPVVFSAAFECLDPAKVSRCFQDTRADILGRLDSWLDAGDTSDSVPVFWVSGLGGTGKTTLAYTFADNCKQRGVRVSSFFCSRDFAERSNPTLIFSSIANQLGHAFPAFKAQLAEVLEAQPHLSTASVPFQLEELIIKPLKTTRNSLPSCLVVIDALDECKDESTTSIILSSLSRYVSEISPLKVLVTSRPVQPITSVFSARSSNLKVASQRLALHELELCVVEHDIKLYLTSSLRDVGERYHLDYDWPLQEDIQALVDRSAGLFIFAATSIKFVEDKNDSDPPGQLKRLLSNDSTADIPSSPHYHLNLLYMQVLTHAFPHISAQLSFRLTMILGSIVFLQEPLSVASLSLLLGLACSVVKQTLSHLGSILMVPKTDMQPIRLLHPSFADFITDSKRCTNDKYIVDSAKQHALLATQCLQAMLSLKKDICEIKNPGLLNGEISDLHARIETNIPPHLQYACRHWTYHLTHGLVLDNIIDLLEEFCNKHLLHWIEVCSLLGELRNMLLGIYSVNELLKEQGSSNFSNTKDVLYDCERFIHEFFSVIDICGLQVYSSALHFTPRQTTLWKLYKNSRSLGGKSTGIDEDWSPCLQTIEGHSDVVTSVAFSPDGTRLVSGSEDETLRLWDAVSGAHLNTLKGHSHYVTSVAFSPDGTRLVSGSSDMTLRLWDAISGAHLNTLKGHSDWVTSAIFSPDGTRLVSWSRDKTVRLWDAVSGAHLNTPEGHSDAITSVAFSLDGSRAVSASTDNTLQLWDTVSGTHLNTLTGHSAPATSVAFSPDGTRLVSGSWDRTLRLWDAVSSVHLNILKGHSDSITLVAFSPDGTRLVSGSLDKTLRLWDTVSGAHLNTLKGHSRWVTSVAFSPDGTRLVSGSSDTTLRLWDAVSGAHLNILKGHSDSVTLVAFSPNGTRLVSGSLDKTLRLWDTVSGAHLNTLKGHSRWVTSVAFSPDGTQLVSGSHDKTLRVWDAVSGTHLNTLRSHSLWVTSVTFSQDGSEVSAVYQDSIRQTYNLYPGCQTEISASNIPGNVNTIRDIVINDGWIMFTDPAKRFCWIPVSYRPSDDKCLAKHGTLLAIGTLDGRVFLLDISALNTLDV